MDAETLVVAQTNREVIPERGNEAEDGKHEVEESAKLYLNPSNSSIYMKNGPAIGIAMSPTEEVREIYLKNMFVMPPNHEFYCPSCEVCISKVLLCTTQPAIAPSVTYPSATVPPVQVPPPTVPPVTPTVPPVGVPVTVPPVTPTVPPVGVPVTVPTIPPSTVSHEDESDVECLVRCSECFTLLIQKGKDFFTGLVSRAPGDRTSGDIAINVRDPSNTVPQAIITEGSNKGWEILKSIVYGGLAELLASLSVVTSAASADAATVSVVALGIANLIGGLTVLTHNLRDLKASKPREEGSETNEAEVDKYYEQLGRRENFYLHAFFAILSFLIFGLVPPIVYGFSFGESDDKDLKLAAVAGASLICITFLAIAKAHTQRTNNTFMTYFKTVTFYVTSGVLASLLTYVAGAQIKKLVEQLGWFQPKPNFALPLPHITVENSGWGSY
ncbi:Membrane protein [Vigna angularis]|uniref:Membrane protein n=1 Tax=Phaseolus angularis TaxID=3914 RepID=A0A8T0JSI3_PHAAN|nr:Membrane protein [Vigna angularis]